MLSLLLMLAFNKGALNRTINTTPPKVVAANSLIQPLTSETCQATTLRSFDLLAIGDHKVNKLIYLQVISILTDSRKAGLNLAITSAFRGCDEQKQLRSTNCPSDSTPSTSCLPPTEKAGESLHNYGMAVDFKCEGYSIFGSSPCYDWLAKNAKKYRFERRSDEAWHWSLVGR